MDSNETSLDGTSLDEGQAQNNQQFEINGELVDIEELKKGYLRQSDYTRKTQELAKEKESLSVAPSINDEELAAETFLQSKDYVKRADILKEVDEKLKKDKDAYYLEKLIDSNPSLKQHESAIKKIAEVDNSALDDIIVKYNFLSSDKLAKAKQRDVIGVGVDREDKKIDIENMTTEQFEAFKVKMGVKWSSWLSRSKTF